MRRTGKVLGLILCIGAFSVMALGSGSTEGSSAEKVGETAVSTATKTEEKTIKKEIKTEYHVGETLTKDGLSVTYVNSSFYQSDNMFTQPAEGKKFIRLGFHVDNQSGSDKTVESYSFACYADGYECDKKYFDDTLSDTISNGRSTDGAVYFEVPEDAKEIEVEYEYQWFSDKKVIFFFEGDKDSGLVFEKNTTVSENVFHIGDIVENGKLRISYLKAGEYVSDNMFLQPEEGNRYVYIELEVENISDSDQMISYFSFDCYADGGVCDSCYGMDDALSATISSGRKAKGTVAFEVPKDAQVIEIEYEDNIWTESKILFLYEE